MANMDKFFTFDASGNQGPATGIESLHVAGTEFFCHSRDSECIRAAIANALFAVVGKEVARSMLDLGSVPAMNLSAAGVWLER